MMKAWVHLHYEWTGAVRYSEYKIFVYLEVRQSENKIGFVNPKVRFSEKEIRVRYSEGLLIPKMK